MATKVDDIPDEVLQDVFVRLTSPRDLVRAAFTCKRWRQAITADSFRVLHIAGHYRVHVRPHADAWRPPGYNPVFVRSSSSPWAGIVARRNLGLDFLPRTEYHGFNWEITDVRGGLLLLLEGLDPHAPTKQQPRLVICDPLARRYRVLPPSAWFHGCDFLGAFLVDGEDAGAPISLSNFRVTSTLYQVPQGTARACTFSSIGRGRGRWTSCCTEYTGWGSLVRFAGCRDNGSMAYWTMGHSRLLTLNKETAKFSSSVLADKEQYAALRDKIHPTEYAYELPWPPIIRACLS